MNLRSIPKVNGKRKVNETSPPPFDTDPAATARHRSQTRRSWAAAGAWLAVIYAAIPWARQLQEFATSKADGTLFFWITGATLFSGLCGLMWARSRQGALSRSGVLVLAAVAALYGGLFWQMRGNPEEAIHCIEYGVLGGLLFRAFRRSLTVGCATFAAAMAGLGCGIIDELIQWLVPARYFDYRDIGINAAAVLLALTAFTCCLPRLPASPRHTRANWQTGWLLASANCFLLLFCFSGTAGNLARYTAVLPWLSSMDEVTAEYGYTHRDPGEVTFFSRLDHQELAWQDSSRFTEVAPLLDRYRTDQQYSEFLRRYPAFRDPLLVEARIHLFRRDRYAYLAAHAGNNPQLRLKHATIAIGENRLLETAFPNILRHSRYRWHPLIKARLLAASNPQAPYHSPVSNSLITAVSRQTVQALLIVACSATLSLALWLDWKYRRSRRQPGHPR